MSTTGITTFPIFNEFNIKVREGIKDSKIHTPRGIEVVQNIQHGLVYDINLSIKKGYPGDNKHNNGNKTADDLFLENVKYRLLGVMSRDLAKVIDIFGLQNQIEYLAGSSILKLSHMETRDYVPIYKIEGGTNVIKYESDSRKILKPINKILQALEATIKITGTANNSCLAYHSERPDHSYLINMVRLYEHDRVGVVKELVNKYRIPNIIATLKSHQFKHAYKIVHPTTTLYSEDRQWK